ncbi:eukaryotic Peptidyl prolyl 4-hydroxylase, alpha subunit protein [Minicystis rosea]|nr:eukaryotic Peptidyl prolyl 4-hydroxylase, alpha subunit protein [Minicystis rosea]
MGMYLGHFDFDHRLLWTVPELFSPAECAAIVAGADAHTWLPATVNRAEGRAVERGLRDSSTAVLHDRAIAEDLHRRVLPHVPAHMTAELHGGSRTRMAVAGVHVPVRIYRYEPGQHFGLHQDQSYFGADGTKSLLTFMVYLNDDFEGGETEFPEQDRIIVPKTGTALLFQHMVLHAGKRVTSGTKLVLRSDVLYRAEEG